MIDHVCTKTLCIVLSLFECEGGFIDNQDVIFKNIINGAALYIFKNIIDAVW